MIFPSLLKLLSPAKIVFASFALAVCLFGAGAQAQPRGQTPTPTPTPEDDDVVERVESNLVLLNVGVADKRGRAITDLSRTDFVVYEDGVRQNITSFEPTSAPFSLVLLLDMSGSTLNFRPTLKQSAIRFLDALAPEDRVAVVAFWRVQKKDKREENLKVLADFTNDRKEISFAITQAEGSGQTNLYDG